MRSPEFATQTFKMLCIPMLCIPIPITREGLRKDKNMKIYENPTIDIEMLTSLDIIRTSDVGTELPPQDETDVNWN